MRSINRFEEPDILVRKKDEWTRKFIESGKARPDNSKYGHRQINTALYSMSHNKCFYCERQLKGVPSEIDHYIEVAENKLLAFEWDNLYLACDNCNDKISNLSISVNDVINPCGTTDIEIESHITFVDEEITALNGSELGLQTIQKYKLSSKQLDYLRAKELKKFHMTLIEIQRKQVLDGRQTLTAQERALLIQFSHPDKPYSLMFKKLLEANGI